MITGASGNLGAKLRRHLEGVEWCALTLLDIQTGNDPAIMQADLSVYDESWVRRFGGQDVVVHLAADPDQSSSWEALQGPNVDALINVYEAAVACGVGRVVYASSSSIMRGYGNLAQPLGAHFPLRPTNNYQAAKAFGERLGKSFSERHGLSVICARIGVMRHGENPPRGAYFEQRYWLSNRDFCQAMEKAIFVRDVKFAALFLTSNNTEPLFDLSETRRILGYTPEDDHRPVRLPFAKRLYHFIRHQAHRVIAAFGKMRRPSCISH